MLPIQFKHIMLSFLLALTSVFAMAQDITIVKGNVTDEVTGEPLPFVNITFVGANIGTTTDFDGNYFLETQWAKPKLLASFIGYKTDTVRVTSGKTQTINFKLNPAGITMEAVDIVATKERYRNKDNPAVDLIKQVIDHKDQNRKEALDFYEYKKYEKIEIDLNNITEDFLEKGWLKKHFQIVIDNIDTSEVNGKPFLPIYLRETASNVYYRKNPKSEKEYQSGVKQTGFEGYVDEDGMSFLMDKLYQDIDIYDNNINLLSNQFTSPISTLAPTIYKFFIIDTTEVNGHECINLGFTPRNKLDFAFTGNLFIINDSSYNVIKVSLGVPKQININFVKDLSLEQEFTQYNDSVWMLTRDKLIIDYNFSRKGRGFYGKKDVTFSDYEFNKPQPDSTYNRVEKIIKEEDAKEKDDEFWDTARPDTLTQSEKDVYVMIDSVQNIKAFRRFMDITMLLVSGWQKVGPYLEVGPITAFYSFNDVEGFRLRGGFRTTPGLKKNMFFDTYLAYGFKDKEFKYLLAYTYSFNKEYLTNPQHKITATYQRETNFPGQDLQFLNDDNFLLSFRRGNSNRMLFYDSYKLDYIHESQSGFSYNFVYENKLQRPVGILEFASGDTANTQYSNNIQTDNVSVNLRFAPNEQFYQGKNFRLPLYNKYPIFQLRYTQGLKDVIQGDIEYYRLSGNIFKRFYLAQLGFTDTELEGGKIFGKVPFPLLNMPQANQSFFLQEASFNMMNFMEFMSDEYVSLKVTHNFNGAIFNRIPLFKHLKLREVVSCKVLYGRLTDRNDPAQNPDLFRFPANDDGVPITYKFENAVPYIEASAGVANIFKILRIELLQRVTYLDNQDIGSTFGVKGLGIRAKGKVDF
ncbi:carboxypeptidase-like regulatory domain-containing protein [Vicingus serpentipes]|uniref:Carboxypeptidase-like regulatory domain-containing protein n=1 Tax=Vicingus serpentipes TaxID=1926625 RepID=A0A5C6RUF4_9FLAO|nr:carboxypeptidase-like regulatory domain-containing protein [Vicingus serpentipes]